MVVTPQFYIQMTIHDQGAKLKRTPQVDKLVYPYPIILNDHVEAHVDTITMGMKAR